MQQNHLDLLLESKRQHAVTQKNRLFSTYMQSLSERKAHSILLSCTGWEEPVDEEAIFSSEALVRLLGPEYYPIQEGGYFIRLQSIGICINPGSHFFDTFCKLGFHLWEIDYVIVTNGLDVSCLDLMRIHTLNRQLNATLLSYEQEPHIIRYLLHPTCFGKLAGNVRPLFREEKNSAECLEPFDDEETYLLGEDLRLTYRSAEQDGSLMLRFETPTRHFGYTSVRFGEETNFFTNVHILLCASAPEQALQSQVKLLLLTEFSNAQGDIRLELVKKVRSLMSHATVLPLDKGMMLDLDKETVQVNETHSLQCQEVSVLRMKDFGKLVYLSSDQIA